MKGKKNVIEPNDEKALVAMDNQEAAIEKATELYGDGEPFNVERILDCMEFRSVQVSKNLEAFGRYCLWLKEGIGWGGFSQALERRGFDRRAAYQAMLQVEKFGGNCATVAQLGVRKAQALTFFTKEEIEKYVQGGDLRGIPHDDVARKTAVELEEEVRRQREKEKRLKETHKKEVEKLNEVIGDLRIRAEDPLSPAQKAARELRGITKDYSIALSKISSGFREAMSILDEAERIPGVGVQELNAWLNEFGPDFATIRDTYTQWQDGHENPGPIAEWKISDLPGGEAQA